jgi:hypothetical protein
MKNKKRIYSILASAIGSTAILGATAITVASCSCSGGDNTNDT